MGNKQTVGYQREFADKEIGLIYTDATVVDENSNSTGATMWECINFDSQKQTKIAAGKTLELLLKDGCFLGSSMAFRTKFRDLILPIPLDIYYIHDNWIALMISPLAECRIVNECLVKYRQHARQSSAGVKINKAKMADKAQLRKNDYNKIINQLSIMKSRLVMSSYNLKLIEDAVSKIEQAKSHLQNRATLPKVFVWRLLIVAKELVLRRYHKYSNGFYSALKDLVLD